MITAPSVKRAQKRQVTFSFQPRGWPDGFLVEATYHPARPERGENGYSLGEPAEPAYCTFEAITLNGKSVREWCNENILGDEDAWAEEAMEHLPDPDDVPDRD